MEQLNFNDVELLLDEDYEPEMESTWQIKDAGMADWAVQRVKSRNRQRDLYVESCMEQIRLLQAKITRETDRAAQDNAFLVNALREYFVTCPAKETKTMKKVTLPNGSLVLKKSSAVIEHDDEQLIAAHPDFVQTKVSFRWGDFKKNLKIVDDKVFDADGEQVEGCTVTMKPETFSVED